MDNIRFYRHPAQSPHQGKSRQASKVIPDGVGNVVDDLILRQDMLAGEKVACVEESSRESQRKDVSAVIAEQEGDIASQPFSPAYSESADSGNDMAATKTSSVLPEVAASNDHTEQKASQQSEEELELSTCHRSLDAQHRDDPESAAAINRGAHNGTSDVQGDLNFEPCSNAAGLKSVAGTLMSSAIPDRPCTSSTSEIGCAGLDHINTMPQSGHETSTSPMRSRGPKVVGPPSSIDAPERPGPSLATSSRHHATSSLVDCVRTHSENCGSEPAIMSQPREQPAHTHDIAIFPMEEKGLWVMSAIVSGLSEMQRLSDSIQAWPIPSGTLPSKNLTILSIKSLNDRRWLILAELTFSPERSSALPPSSRERLDRPQDTKCKRRAPEDSDSSQDSENDECYTPERATKTERRRKSLHGGRSGKRQRTAFEHEYSGGSQLKRGDWQEDEDQELTRLVETATPWPAIFATFPNRSEAAVRSRWYCTLKPLVAEAVSALSALC